MAGMQLSQEELDKLVEEAEHLTPAEVQSFLDTYAERTIQRRSGHGHSYKDLTPDQKQKRKEYNAKRRNKEKQMIAIAKEMGLIK